MNKLTFEQAERIAEERMAGFKEVTMQQGKTAVKDLPFVQDCYNGSEKEIEKLNSCLSITDAKKLTKVYPYLHLEELAALLRTETPELYAAFQQYLTYAALITLIDFRAGKKMFFSVRAEK